MRDEQVAAVPAERGAGAILGDRESEAAQLSGDGVRTGALASRRAGNPAERREGVVQPPALGLAGSRHEVPTAGCPPERTSAAPTNSRNSGAGRSGRDLNSGWNCEAT